MPRRSPRSAAPHQDPYRVLGVPRDADLPAIKQAFRERALECHPDRAAAGEEEAATDEFVRVRAAFDVLSDPELRRRYDTRRRTERRSAQPHSSRSRSASSSRNGQPSRKRSKRGASQADARTRRAAHRRKGGRFATAWRTGDTPNVWVGPMSDRVHGLSKRHDRLHQHHRRVVPISAVAGAMLFVAQPSIIHTSVPLVGLLLCTVVSAACGFALSMVWGILRMLVTDYQSGG